MPWIDTVSYTHLQLADGLDRGVIHHPDRLPAVGGLQRVEQVNQLISGDGGGAGGCLLYTSRCV